MSMLFMATDLRQPRKRPTSSLTKKERIDLGALYYHGNDTKRALLVRKWGKGRMRKCLREFADAEISASLEALRMRDEII